MFRRESRILGAVIALAILTTIAAFPFHLMAEHSDEAHRGVCAVCIALSLGLAPSDDGLTAARDDVVSRRVSPAHTPHVRNVSHPLIAPRGPPSSLA